VQTMDDVEIIYDHRWNKAELDGMRKVWQVLVGDYFQKFIQPESVVMDMGAGFCFFINSVRARRRIALDANSHLVDYVDQGVEAIVSGTCDLSMFADGELTHVFMSNFLEHLPDSSAVVDLLKSLRRKISNEGSILILQPNFRYTMHQYFDFIDHHVVLTDKSLVEALEIAGFSVQYLCPQFLPYTSKSKLPKSPLLVKLYLRLPFLWKLFGGQAFVVARPKSGTA